MYCGEVKNVLHRITGSPASVYGDVSPVASTGAGTSADAVTSAPAGTGTHIGVVKWALELGQYHALDMLLKKNNENMLKVVKELINKRNK